MIKGILSSKIILRIKLRKNNKNSFNTHQIEIIVNISFLDMYKFD